MFNIYIYLIVYIKNAFKIIAFQVCNIKIIASITFYFFMNQKGWPD